MFKNKKNIFCLLLVFILIIMISCTITVTYAKYMSSVSGSDKARVAKWAWTINSNDLNNELLELSIDDLFSAGNVHNLVENTCHYVFLDENIQQNGDAIIAPGTCGYTNIEITNNSEVNAKYQIIIQEKNQSGIPLAYAYSNQGNWYTPDEFNEIDNMFNKNVIKAGETKKISLYWKWDYETENGDGFDTTLGTYSNSEVEVKVKLNITQIN